MEIIITECPVISYCVVINCSCGEMKHFRRIMKVIWSKRMEVGSLVTYAGFSGSKIIVPFLKRQPSGFKVIVIKLTRACAARPPGAGGALDRGK